jgi:hypothetical protein
MNTMYINEAGVAHNESLGIVMSKPPNEQFSYNWKNGVWEDARTLKEAKQNSWDKVKTLRAASEELPFMFDGILYDANVTNISGATQMAVIAKAESLPFSIEWTTFDNSIITLDLFKMISLGTTLGFRNSEIYDTARQLREQIESATTNEQVDAITWPS